MVKDLLHACLLFLFGVKRSPPHRTDWKHSAVFSWSLYLQGLLYFHKYFSMTVYSSVKHIIETFVSITLTVQTAFSRIIYIYNVISLTS